MDKKEFIKIFNKQDALSHALGMELVELEETYAVAQMCITKEHLNFMGTLHGGTLFTLADVAAGTAISATGQNCVTLSSNINYIRAVNEGMITARAEVVHRGRTTGVCDVKISSEEGKLLCKGTFTMFMTGKEILL